jgi:peptide/nickel transport system substrate-binding protein
MQKQISLLLAALVFGSSVLPQVAMSKAISSSGNISKRAQSKKVETTDSSDSLAIVNPANPGVHKTVLVNGQECKQGRFAAGFAGGVLVRSIVGFDPRSFNPWTELDAQSSALTRLMWRGLVDVDPFTGEVVPDLASDFKLDKDGVTYTTHLRKGLKWSDGKPITAEDVAFTWNTLVKGGYGSSSVRDMTTIDGKSPQVTAVDALTNKFVMPKTFAPFARFLNVQIAPKHIIEPMIKGKDGRLVFQRLYVANTAPSQFVTSGPFTLSRFVPSQRVEFLPNKNFFMVNKQHEKLPYLSKLIYLIVPDPKTNLMKFHAREIDLIPVEARDVVPMISQQETENFKIWNLGQDFKQIFMMFNMNRRSDPSTHKPYVDAVKQAWFNDVNFRQAVNHAVDRNMMVANVYRGIGYPMYVCVPYHTPWYNHKLRPFAADFRYSMSLLAKSGFKKGADGFLYDKDGHKVEFDMLAAAGGGWQEGVGNMVVEDLKHLGIKVNYQLIDFNVLGDKLEHSLDWQACLFAFNAGDPLEPNDGANVFKTAGRLHLFDQRLADKSGNVKVTDARDWEKRIDQIFNQGVGTLDKVKRKALYDEYQKIVYDQAPFIYLVSPFSIAACRKNVGNYVPTRLSQTENGVHNVEEIYKK